MHSDRGAVYRHGGDPNGEITAEHHTAQGNKRDAVTIPRQPPRTRSRRRRSRPSTGSRARSTTPNVESNAAKAHAPRHARSISPSSRCRSRRPRPDHRRSRATTTSRSGPGGQEGRRHPGCSTAPSGRSPGTCRWTRPDQRRRQGRSRPRRIQDLLKDGPTRHLKDWSLAPGAGSAFEGFSTVALAMQRTPAQLLEAGCSPRATTTRRPTRTSARRWTPRRRSSRSRSTATRPTELHQQGQRHRQRHAQRRASCGRGRHPAQQRRGRTSSRSAGPTRSAAPRASRRGWRSASSCMIGVGRHSGHRHAAVPVQRQPRSSTPGTGKYNVNAERRRARS